MTEKSEGCKGESLKTPATSASCTDEACEMSVANETELVQSRRRLFKDLAKECGTDSALFRGLRFKERMEHMIAFYDEGVLKPAVKCAMKKIPGVQIIDKVDLIGSRINLDESKLVCASGRVIGGERLAEEFPDYYNLYISASQFNLLESPNEYHANLYDYGMDRTQGPTVCSISLLGCLKRESQFDEDTLGDLLSESIRKDFSSVYKAGYLKAGFLEEKQAEQLVLSLLKDPIKFASQDLVADVQKNPAYEKLCRQVFFSAISYQRTIDGFHRPAVTYVTLRGQYINAMKDAINMARKNPNKQVAVHIPCVGGGAFRNPKGTAQLAFLNAYKLLENEIDGNLTVFLHGGDNFWVFDFENTIESCALDVIDDLADISMQEGLSESDRVLLTTVVEELKGINQEAIAKFVKKKGFGYYERKDSSTACLLHEAARKGDTRTMSRLLAEGAAVDATDVNQNTALYVAAENGQAAAVKVLLASGADVEPMYPSAKSPISIATENGHLDIVELLTRV